LLTFQDPGGKNFFVQVDGQVLGWVCL
jgi:hypothetical protein